MNRTPLKSTLCQVLFGGMLVATSACVSPSLDDADGVVIAEQVGAADDGFSRYSEADEAQYMARFRRLAEGGSGGAGLGAYDTLESVAGASAGTPLPRSPTASLSSSALQQANAYAEIGHS